MADGEILHGQQYEPAQDIVFPFTEQTQNTTQGGSVAALGDARTEVTPIDANASKVRVFSPNTTLLNAYYLAVDGTASYIDLPDTLTALIVVYNYDNKNGEHSQDADGISAGTAASLTIDLNSRSESSASVSVDLQPNITSRRGRDVPVTHYYFYMQGNVTQAAAITRINSLASITVNAWPSWRPTQRTFTLKGQAVSVSADAEAQQHVSFNDSNVTYSWGRGLGQSKGFSSSVRTIVIPPTIHVGFSVTGSTSQASTATANAEAGWDANGDNWPVLPDGNPSVTSTAVATGSVTPTSVSATTGSTSVPTSGLYLHEMRVSPWRDGYNIVFMEVVNFANVG